MSVRVPFAMPIVPEIGLAAVLRPALIAARIQISTPRACATRGADQYADELRLRDVLDHLSIRSL